MGDMTQGDMETGRREKKDRDTERCETIETGRQRDRGTVRQGDRETGGGRCGEGTTRRTPNLLNVGNSQQCAMC